MPQEVENEEPGTVFQQDQELELESPKGTIPMAIPAQQGLGHNFKQSPLVAACNKYSEWVMWRLCSTHPFPLIHH